MSEFTRILSQIQTGNTAASDQLLPLVYDELRKLAQVRLKNEKPGQTLQATALVHEAFVRLVDQEAPQQWDNQRHFFAAAAEAMRRILIDRARQKQSLKRGGDRETHRNDRSSGTADVADRLRRHPRTRRGASEARTAARSQSGTRQAKVLCWTHRSPSCPGAGDLDHDCGKRLGVCQGVVASRNGWGTSSLTLPARTPRGQERAKRCSGNAVPIAGASSLRSSIRPTCVNAFLRCISHQCPCRPGSAPRQAPVSRAVVLSPIGGKIGLRPLAGFEEYLHGRRSISEQMLHSYQFPTGPPRDVDTRGFWLPRAKRRTVWNKIK